jgi:hypothetical protein
MFSSVQNGFREVWWGPVVLGVVAYIRVSVPADLYLIFLIFKIKATKYKS